MASNQNTYVEEHLLGFRFAPNDGEILYYLKKKVKNEPMPFNGIKEVKVYDHYPQILAEKYPPLGEKEWFFFTPRDRKHQNSKRPNRMVGDGFWKATGGNKEVNYNNEIVGFKQVLVFFEDKGKKTNWIMHEYKINNLDDVKFDDMVLCRIYNREVKPKPSRNYQEEAAENRVDRIEYASETNPVVDNMDLEGMVCNYVPEIPPDCANGSFMRLLMEPDVTNTDQVNTPLETLDDRLNVIGQLLGVDDLNDNMDVEGMICNYVPEIPADCANGSFMRPLMELDITNTDQVNTPLETLDDRFNIRQLLGVEDLNDYSSFPDVKGTSTSNVGEVATMNGFEDNYLPEIPADYANGNSVVDNMDGEGMICNYVPEIPADCANGSFMRLLMEPDATNTDQVNTPLETLEDGLNNVRQLLGVEYLNDYSSFPDVKGTSTGSVGEVAMMNGFQDNSAPVVPYLSNGSGFPQVPADLPKDDVADELSDLPLFHEVPDDLFYFNNDDDFLFAEGLEDIIDLDVF